MLETELQALCERGQIELMETRYLDAVASLTLAEQTAWDAKSFDTLARLYLPLQEARRQIRQRCGEGAVRFHLLPLSPAYRIDPQRILEETPQGQLLVGGWGTVEPAVEVRRIAKLRGLYVETFLGSVSIGEDGIPIVSISPVEGWEGPCLILKADDIPADVAVGNAASFAGVMDIWERLHKPFLRAAASEPDPIQRMQAYRFTLQVDPACELAHQFMAEIARKLARC